MKKLSPERRAILQALEDATEPLTPAQVAAATGKHPGSVRKLLFSMLEDGQVEAGSGHTYWPTLQSSEYSHRSGTPGVTAAVVEAVTVTDSATDGVTDSVTEPD